MTIERLLAEYLEIFVPCIIDQAVTRSRVRTLLNNLSGNVEEISHEKLINYRQVRDMAGTSPASINKEFSVLQSAINWGVRFGSLPSDYRLSVPLAETTGKRSVLSVEQINRLVSAAIDIRLKGFIRLAFLTGQRLAALRGLRYNQCISGVIEFNDSTPGLQSRRKNRSRIPVSSEILDVFKSLRETYGDTEYVFPGTGGRGFWQDIDREFSRLARRCGLEATCHTIRHSTATVLIENGASIVEVSKMLGHSKTATTEIYLHQSPQFLNNNLTKLGAMLA